MSYSDQPPGTSPPAAAPAGAPVGAVAPTYTLTPWIKRVAAYLIDSVIGSVIYFIGFVTGKASLVLLFGLLSIVFWVWNRVYRMGTTGQSIGKSALSIKLIRESDAQVVGPALAFGRDICHIVDAAPWFIPVYIGFLWPLWDQKRQTFADKIVHTVVIDV